MSTPKGDSSNPLKIYDVSFFKLFQLALPNGNEGNTKWVFR
jgi:hypothetical protein